MDQMSMEDFKCLIYTWRLQTIEDNEALLRCIARLETEILTKLQDLMEMCQQMLQTKEHARMVTEATVVVAKFKMTTWQKDPSSSKNRTFPVRQNEEQNVWSKKPLEK